MVLVNSWLKTIRSSTNPGGMGKFINLTGNDGRYYFNLLASNGTIILSSEGYATDAERHSGIQAIQEYGAIVIFEKKISENGKYYFLLKDANGKLIGNSELYGSEAGRDNGIESVKNNARDALVEMA